MIKILLALQTLVLILTLGCNSGTDSSTPAAVSTSSTVSTTSVTTTTAPKPTTAVPALKLVSYNGTNYSIKKPAGWDIVTAGDCNTFSFFMKDKKHPANQIIFFQEVGPVYLAEAQKTIDKKYMDMGGRPILWYEMPVVDPLTPENFLSSFHLISATKLAQALMPGLPAFNNVEIISVTEETNYINGGQTKVIRALFLEGGELGEGLFYITTAPVLPVNGMVSAGIGLGYSFIGITAVKSDFKYLEKTLAESLDSFALSKAYIDYCLKMQQMNWEEADRMTKTPAGTSGSINDAWDNRSSGDDIYSQKKSDEILGRDRVYDPDTGIVYEVSPGFYANYNLNRDRYRQENLQPLPDDDLELWTAPAEPEPQPIR
jgi:hypothetical protein